MTVVELFSREPAENLLSALCLKPEKLVYLGTRDVMTDRRIAAVRSFFRNRRNAPTLRFLRVAEGDYAATGNAIEDILREDPACAFEMTGGSDLILAALGTAAVGHSFTMFEMDVRKQALRIIRGGMLPQGALRPLTGISAAACVRLFGGELYESSYTLSGKLPEGLEDDIQALWRVYGKAPQTWTKECSRLAVLCAQGGGQGLSYNGEMPEKCARSFIDRLRKEKLLTAYREEGSRVSLRFRNEHVKRTLTRAGDLLELWVFLAARSDPASFTDAVMGAKIRWTGEERGTTNEIDGLVMHGAVPLYISCKIGSVPKEALYEVDSVAARFGGAYAAKVLICGHLGGSESARQALRQRAADMEILLIENVDALSRPELAEKLRKHASDGPRARLLDLK